MKKKTESTMFRIGLILTIIGVILFLSTVRVGDFSFTHLGKFNTGPVIVIIWCLALAFLVIYQNLFFEILLAVITLALVVVIILNVHIYVVSTSMIKFLGILVLLFGGAGMMIRELFF